MKSSWQYFKKFFFPAFMLFCAIIQMMNVYHTFTKEQYGLAAFALMPLFVFCHCCVSLINWKFSYGFMQVIVWFVGSVEMIYGRHLSSPSPDRNIRGYLMEGSEVILDAEWWSNLITMFLCFGVLYFGTKGL